MLVEKTTVTRAPVDASVLSVHVGPDVGGDPGIRLYRATKLNVAQSCDDKGGERDVAMVIVTVVEEMVGRGGGEEEGGGEISLGERRFGAGGGGGEK